MASSVKVVLFEDTAQTRSDILAALRTHLEPRGSVIAFDSDQFSGPSSERDRMYEDRLASILNAMPYEGATLLVADRDLSKSRNFAGLSVNAVTAAAKRLALPIASYAREPEQDDYEWRGRWEEEHIVLSFSEGEDELARRAALAACGFAELAAELPEVLAQKANDSPAKMLAALLSKPEYSEKIALYSVGDQNRLLEALAHGRQLELRVERMTRFLGYWLWDSLLRYPGLLANEVAAASHLNLETAGFRQPEVRAVFAEALYSGPFADPKKPQWWRGMLDDIVSREDCADGLELVRKTVDPTIRCSQCYVDASKQAGYYCIISRLPVSLENSKGGLSWFPRGADLTRIGKPKFEEYAPWFGA